ncbi:MAG: diguanylate cyclase domain-containing protein [Gaiellales bacterium]
MQNVHQLHRDEPGWYRRLFDRIGMPLAVVSADRGDGLVVVAANPALGHRLGARRSELVGRPLWEWIAADQRSVVRAGLEALYRGELSALREECTLASRRGDIAVILEASPVGDRELALDFVDISDRAQAERTLHELAFHDPLTGVANRMLLHDRLEHALASRQPNAALLVLDLDRFKEVNDSLGHLAGDEVLVAVAGRLQDCVRSHDTVARLGGDEFAILLEGGFGRTEGAADVAARAEQIASRAAARLADPVRLSDGRSVTVGASIGVAVTGDVNTADGLFSAADAEMYDSKHGRRHRRSA